jgi:hypothetical protein
LKRALFPLWITGGTEDDQGALGEVYGGSADRTARRNVSPSSSLVDSCGDFRRGHMRTRLNLCSMRGRRSIGFDGSLAVVSEWIGVANGDELFGHVRGPWRWLPYSLS